MKTLPPPGGGKGRRSTTPGLNLGFHLQVAALSVEGADSDGGGGAGIRVGYGFNRIVTGFLQIDGSSIDTKNAPRLSGEWGMAHVDLGVGFHFANSLRVWVPYLEAAVGARAVSAKDAQVAAGNQEDVSFKGGRFHHRGRSGRILHRDPGPGRGIALQLRGVR